MNANTCPKHWHKKEWWLTCPTCPNTAPDDDYFGIGTGQVQSESNKDTVTTATPGEAKASDTKCQTCRGSGRGSQLADGFIETCPTCNGSGTQEWPPDYRGETTVTCPTCHGTGTAKATSEEAASTSHIPTTEVATANDTSPSWRHKTDTTQNTGIPGKSGDTTPNHIPDAGKLVSDTSPGSFDVALRKFEIVLEERGRHPDILREAHALSDVRAAHNAALLAELQTLASSNNWRVQLESRIAQLKEAK